MKTILLLSDYDPEGWEAEELIFSDGYIAKEDFENDSRI